MLEYSMEDLVPVVSWLSLKYTGKESSRVTYERAIQLMDAVRYCIRELEYKRINSFLYTVDLIPAKRAYAEGYQLVVLRINKAKKCYERIIDGFQSYGCKCYYHTVFDELPKFFAEYDPLFAPQKELVTLDYPLMRSNPKRSGIDKIDEYLEALELEQNFLKAFTTFRIQHLLQKQMPGYESVCQINITEPVFLRALGSMIANEKVNDLSLTLADYDTIRNYFQSDSDAIVVAKLETLTEKLMHCINTSEEKMTEYFISCCKPLAKRIVQAAAENYISAIF